MVTGSEDKRARVWDARTGQTLTELKGHTDSVLSVAISGDGSRIVTGSKDRTARVWDTRSLDQVPPEEERLRRLWVTRPDPEWNAMRAKDLAAEGNSYGAALQRAYEARARAVVALDYGALDAARAFLFLAAVLMPPVPKVLDLAPPPREQFPRIPIAVP